MKFSRVKRELLGELEHALKLREYLAVLGPRQSGKTTLLEMIRANHPEAGYLSFENSKILTLFEDDIDAFAELYCKNSKLLLIDEFQYAINGGKNLKYLFDAMPSLKIIITGSSSLELRAKVGKFMVGRILFFHLHPFSFAEFLSHRNSDLHRLYRKRKFNFYRPRLPAEGVKTDPTANHFLPPLEEYLLYGGYPRAVTIAKREDKKLILEGIFSTYLLKDVVGFWKVEKERAYQKLVNLLALQIGSLANLQELSRSLQLKHAEIMRYLDILKQSYILQEVPPFYKNPRTELVKMPKHYFFDLGLRNSVIENFTELRKRNDHGELAENFAAIHLQLIFNKLNFWRTKSKAEVDFIVKKDDKLIPIEVKFQPNYAAVPKSFYSFFEKYRPPYGLILTRDTQGVRKIGSVKVYFYPIYLI